MDDQINIYKIEPLSKKLYQLVPFKDLTKSVDTKGGSIIHFSSQHVSNRSENENKDKKISSNLNSCTKDFNILRKLLKNLGHRKIKKLKKILKRIKKIKNDITFKLKKNRIVLYLGKRKFSNGYEILQSMVSKHIKNVQNQDKIDIFKKLINSDWMKGETIAI